MFKNTAGQKLTVYAWDSATGLPKTGDAANLAAYRSLDDGTVTVLADRSATETDATNAKGYYLFDLSQAETNGDKIAFSAKSSTSGVVVLAVPAVVQTVPSSGVASQSSVTDLGTRLPAALTGDGMMKSDMLYVNGTGQSNGDVNLKIDAVKTDTAAIKLVTDDITFTVAGAVDVNIVAWLGFIATVDVNNYPFIGSVNTKTGYALTGAYDPAKTAAQATDQTAIKAKTDQLVFTTPNKVDATATATLDQDAIDDIADGVVAAIDIPTSAEIAADLSAGAITITTSPITLGNALNIYTGDAYVAANGKSITFAITNRSDLVGLIPHLLGKSGSVTFDIAAPAVVSATQTITFGDLTAAVTATLKAGSEENPHPGEYQIRFLDGSGNKATQVSGVMYVRTGLSA